MPAAPANAVQKTQSAPTSVCRGCSGTIIGVALLTAAVFAQSVEFGFINFDDGKNFVENWNFRGFGADNLKWMWTTTQLGPYQPLSWMSLGLDYLLWGETPSGELRTTGFHLTNVLLHVLNSVLVFCLGRQLMLLSCRADRSDPPPKRLTIGAAVAALFFSLHPLRVEVVAWATERRELLSTLFLLGAVLAWLRSNYSVDSETKSRDRRWYALSLIFYCLSLLSKAMGMTLPVVLLILDIYLARSQGSLKTGSIRSWLWQRVPEKLPYVIIAIPVMVMAIAGQRDADAMMPWDVHPLSSRLAVCCYGLAWYARTTILPVRLAPMYPFSLPVDLLEPPFVISYFFVFAVTFGVWVNRHRLPSATAGWAASVLLVSPVLGLTQSGGQIAADRYTYLPCIPWALLIGGLWTGWCIRSGPSADQPESRRRVLILVPGVVLSVLTVLTTFQLQLWKTPERLWSHTVQVTSENSFAMMKLSMLKIQSGRLSEAEEVLRQVLRIDPDDPTAHCELGTLLAGQGNLKEAGEHFRKALEIVPGYAEVYVRMGRLLKDQQQLPAAVRSFEVALQLNPRLTDAHVEYAVLLNQQGMRERALPHLQTALEIRPDHVVARRTLALLLRDSGNIADAETHWREYRRRTNQPPLDPAALTRDLEAAD